MRLAHDLLHNLNLAVIVAVAVVWMMEMSIHKVVNMIAVRYSLMPAVFTMRMLHIVRVAGMAICTFGWVGRVYFQRMLVHMSVMGVVQVSIVQVIGVVAVLNSSVPAVFTVLMSMIWMNSVILRHNSPSRYWYSVGISPSRMSFVSILRMLMKSLMLMYYHEHRLCSLRLSSTAKPWHVRWLRLRQCEGTQEDKCE